MNRIIQQVHGTRYHTTEMVKVLHKRKEDTNDTNRYCGISLECSPFKGLTRLLTKRLQVITKNMLPDQQFGFMSGRCALQAVTNLLNDTEDTLRWPKGKLYTVFIDYTKPFDLLGSHDYYLCRNLHCFSIDHCIPVIVLCPVLILISGIFLVL